MCAVICHLLNNSLPDVMLWGIIRNVSILSSLTDGDCSASISASLDSALKCPIILCAETHELMALRFICLVDSYQLCHSINYILSIQTSLFAVMQYSLNAFTIPSVLCSLSHRNSLPSLAHCEKRRYTTIALVVLSEPPRSHTLIDKKQCVP